MYEAESNPTHQVKKITSIQNLNTIFRLFTKRRAQHLKMCCNSGGFGSLSCTLITLTQPQLVPMLALIWTIPLWWPGELNIAQSTGTRWDSWI